MGLADRLKAAAGMGTSDTPDPETPGAPQDASDLADLRSRFQASDSGRQRGRKRPTPVTARDAARDAQTVSDLLSPKNVGRLVKLPFDTAFALTGFEGWALDSDEEAVLSTTWAVAAQYLLPTMNPGLIAVAIASINTTVILSKKAYLYRQDRREAAESTGNGAKRA